MAYPLIFGYLIAGVLDQFFSIDLIVKLLSGNKMWQSIKAALFGIPLPLCSCSVLPVAETLRQKGVGRGAITSFVISTPQTGIDSIIVTYGALGIPFALFKALAAFFSGVIGGFFVDFFYSGQDVKIINQDEKDSEHCCACKENAVQHSLNSSIFAKIAGIIRYAFFTLPAETSLYLLIGFVVGTLLNIFIPENFFERFIGNQILEIIAVLIFSIPVYVCASASVPVALVLLLKGLSPGAVFVFLMCGPASNTVSLIFMQRILGVKGLFIYIISLVSTALIFGLMINYLFLELKIYSISNCHLTTDKTPFEYLATIILILMVFWGLLNKYCKELFLNRNRRGKNENIH